MPLSRLTRKRSRRSKKSEHDVGERLRPLSADGATCIIDEHEVAIGQQRARAIAGIGLVLSPGKHQHRPFDLAECFIAANS